jgi:hypothetical protein
MLISASAVLESCRRQTHEVPERIASLGVITRSRPENLERCLRSYVENCQRFERDNDFIVMDDSEDPLTRAGNKELLQLLKREKDVKIRYGGREEKTLFANSLISEGGFDPELLNFALINSDGYEFSCGKNRNALFLDTIGDLIFSTDDDAVCRISSPSDSGASLEQRPRGQPLTPVEFWFFAKREDALSFADFVDEDLLELHEQLLGRTIADCLATFGDLDLLSSERPMPYHLRSLQSHDSRVIVTLTGMLGDSGMRVPATYKVLGRASRERLIQSKESYLSACSSREVMRVATRTCLSNRTWFISTALAYDNREMLPPFFPVLRGTDGIFAATLDRCSQGGYLGDVPRAILHLPTRSRRYRHDQIIESADGITMHSLIVACLLSRQFWPGMTDGAERMRAMGRHLIELGSMKLADFEEFARVNLWRQQSEMMANLEKDLLDYEDPPDYWANDLKDYLARMRLSFSNNEFVVPLDLRSRRRPEQARDLSRTLVLKFGKLLCEWPDIIDTARRLRARGERLATPI